MITIRPGSHVHTLLSILPFVGEYPMPALRLLGSVRSYKDLIHKLTQVQEFRFSDSDERFTCRLLNVCGRGNRKTVRFHKSALPMLKWWDVDMYSLYMEEYDDHNFSGNARHVSRNHLLAETAVMCLRAGIKANPLDAPDLEHENLFNFRDTILMRKEGLLPSALVVGHKVICFPEQLSFVQGFFGDLADVATVTMDDVERVLEIDRPSLIE